MRDGDERADGDACQARVGCTSAMLSDDVDERSADVGERHEPMPAGAFEHRRGRRVADADDRRSNASSCSDDDAAGELGPDPGAHQRIRQQHQRRRAIGTTVASDSRVPTMKISAAADRAALDASLSTTVGKSTSLSWLVRRWVTSASRWPTAQTATALVLEEDADDDGVDRVVQLVRPVDERHVDAERRDLAQPRRAGTSASRIRRPGNTRYALAR